MKGIGFKWDRNGKSISSLSRFKKTLAKSSCIITWFGNCTTFDRKTLQRIVRTAEKIIEVSLPSITNIYITRCIRKATNIEVFTLLPSGRRYRSIQSRTFRLCNSIRLLNSG
ncbi:hypothetical protein P4O66_019112 [Electrophorus voltai]|uniref:Uncharacterized protein n=1 Tax=Electrophorus voltai TaxID=2609070 RepID=A0AAD8YQR2_9TELE|nr:hypothetical protein P4O66_019112 [Electrophorus voltai]